ncbi:SDR family oxidoreductase [Paenibacillus solisilvae]|uniref:SDR family oxidoreductase n=1 Tax=Paenibacillus solisilvae TaxID=2486751 RepID=A0ABW0VX50_9BACL
MELRKNENKVALVTGANKGIGKEIARGLARQGITVLLGARDSERGAQAVTELSCDGKLFFQQLDVTDLASVRVAAQQIEDRFGKLDILVNNAGIAVKLRKTSEVNAAEFREVYETNVFGVVTVTHELLPLLRRAPAARIVNISSYRGSLGSERAFNGQPFISYSTSKTALNAITVHYARELADTPIKVNAGAPGHCATDFNNFSGPRTPEQGAAIAIRLATLDEYGPTGGLFDDNGPVPW